MPSHIESSRNTAGYLPGLLLFASSCFTPVEAEADQIILTNGVVSEGSVMLIGDKKQWDTFVGTEPISSASGYLAIDPDAERASVKATWSGGGEAQFFVAHEAPMDYSEHLEQDSALVVVIKVEKKPKSEVLIRMGCGYPCASDADISKLLDALPDGQWVRLSFDLKCFVDGGLNIENVDTPLLLTTKGEMALSIADISIAPGIGPEATIRCRQ